ncbi:hypothetical protein MKX01_028193 [Papaver californicum]|nr:hypothetical protein MKX01_028193 [Papaver californicum]
MVVPSLASSSRYDFSGELFSDSTSDYYNGTGAMLPMFLQDLARNDQTNGEQDYVEITLELEDHGGGGIDDTRPSVVICNVNTPRSTSQRSQHHESSSASFRSKSFSATSRIRKKFAWLRSPSTRTSVDVEAAPVPSTGLSSRDARRIKAKLDRSLSSTQQALKGLRFINKNTTTSTRKGKNYDANELWLKVESRFFKLAKDGLLSREDFGECIGMVDSKEFAIGIFDALARRRHQKVEKINKDELHEFWLQISDQSFDARLQIFFDMADSNEDGRITREEVRELIMLSASANKLSKLKEQAEEYASLIMEELDPEGLGYIELWQLETLLLQRDNYMNYSRPLSISSVNNWNQHNNRGTGGGTGTPSETTTLVPRALQNLVRKVTHKIKYLVLENWQRAWIMSVWILIMAGLFGWKFYQYRHRAAFEVMGYCFGTAKGAAETLKFNMALILLPVCRNMLTWLRSTRARLFVPFDDNINFHKVVASAIAVGILVHTGNHLVCDFPRLVHSSKTKFDLIASEFKGVKPTFKFLFTGIECVTGFTMLALMTIAFVLATGRFRKNLVKLPPPLNRMTGFNAFWYSHHLFTIVYILLIIHGESTFFVHDWYQKTTWMYICVPLLLYAGERSLRTRRSRQFSVKIFKVSVLPGNVFSLTMSKPQGFKYKSGQYIFLQCPTISSFEWHPFSITSAPGDDYLSVHIRTVGDWTRELMRVFTETCSSPSNIGLANFSEPGRIDQRGLPRLSVDGPYGAPAQDYRNYDVLLLVGLGIGATPFISILRDLLNNVRLEEDQTDSSVTDMSRSEDNSLNSVNSLTTTSATTSSSIKKKPQRTTSAHFYWVTREPGSFEWFKGVMNEVAEMDQKGVIEMHNYLTSVYEEGDARSTLLTMVQALNHAKNGVDILSGTRVRTHFARPNWREVFTKIASKHPYSTVGVFYCGMPVLAKELRKLSLEKSQTTTTRFEFHKEYF